MKNKDAKQGMTIKKVESKPHHRIPVGETIKILEVEGNPTIDGAWCEREDGEKINIELKYFEPTKKFKVGDELVFGGEYKGDIIAYEPRLKSTPYVLCIKTESGYSIVQSSEEDLSATKDKTKLKKGDKFLTQHESEGECTVLCRGTNFFGGVEYYYENQQGETDIVSVDYIKEVLV